MPKQKQRRTTVKPHQADCLTWSVMAASVVGLILAAALPLYWWRGHERRHSARVIATRPVRVERTALDGKLRFTDAGVQAREFIGYNTTIQLTAGQEAVKREVLAAMPAACCRDSNAYTCCCGCNLSKSVWGLSNYVLTTHHATADQLREVVNTWKEFANPAGFSGSSCYSGGCSLPFHQNGCGGMSESNVVL